VSKEDAGSSITDASKPAVNGSDDREFLGPQDDDSRCDREKAKEKVGLGENLL
jgi:hypothetical protein